MTFGNIETRIRRDLINDNDADQYRWTVAAVMSAMSRAVKEIPTRINAWAGFDEQDRPIDFSVPQIASVCDVAGQAGEITDEQMVALRQLAIPLNDRYADAIAYLAASYLLATDDSDTANAEKSAVLAQKGKEEAMA